MSGLFEPASTGRAKCRACSNNIAKGELRFGEKLPNPFADGETTYWFHLECAAYRRSEAFAQALEEATDPPEQAQALASVAKLGAEHPRLARISKLQRSPSGRARCRHCRDTIAKDGLRVALDIFQEGRFDPIGFIHVGCAADYFGVLPDLAWVERAAAELSPEDRKELAAQLAPGT